MMLDILLDDTPELRASLEAAIFAPDHGEAILAWVREHLRAGRPYDIHNIACVIQLAALIASERTHNNAMAALDAAAVRKPR